MQTKWFPKKDARFSKIKNILNLLCNDNEGKINENINFDYFSNRASLMGNPVPTDKVSKSDLSL